MGWNELDNKLKRRLDRAFVSCDEDYELQTVADAVLEEFPSLTRDEVLWAIDGCCKSIRAPRPRSEFLRCLRKRLS